jgi:hypothetical protein
MLDSLKLLTQEDTIRVPLNSLNSTQMGMPKVIPSQTLINFIENYD